MTISVRYRRRTRHLFDVVASGASTTGPIVVCFGCAGAGITWIGGLASADPTRRYVGVLLGGREANHDLGPETSVAAVADEVADELSQAAIAADVVFGLSLGGLLAFEVLRRLPSAPGPLVVVGTPAPSRGTWTDTDVLGDSASVLVSGLPDASSDVLRRDLELARTFEPVFGAVLVSDITSVRGSEDPLLGPAAVRGWRLATTGRHVHREVDADHLPTDHQLLAVLAESLSRTA